MNITRLRIPTGGRQTSWLFPSVAEKLYSGLPRTTSARGQLDLNPRATDFKSDTLTIRPRCLPFTPNLRILLSLVCTLTMWINSY